MLAFDGDQHVGQLQFRRYEPGVRSPQGLWDPLYWADFAGHAPALPAGTLAVFCCHVGQRDDTDARDPQYQGRRLGLRLLDHFLDWASQAGFAAVVAKAVPALRTVMLFMGGQPAGVYRARGRESGGSTSQPSLIPIGREPWRSFPRGKRHYPRLRCSTDPVLPFFEAPEGPVSRMLTDRGTEYWGSPAREDELDLAVENLEHTRTTGKSPPTKGIVERLPKMLLTEFSRMTFRKMIDPSLVELQTDSEEWGRSSNEERVHQGRWGFGRTPKQLCIATLPVAKATL